MSVPIVIYSYKFPRCDAVPKSQSKQQRENLSISKLQAFQGSQSNMSHIQSKIEGTDSELTDTSSKSNPFLIINLAIMLPLSYYQFHFAILVVAYTNIDMYNTLDPVSAKSILEGKLLMPSTNLAVYRYRQH